MTAPKYTRPAPVCCFVFLLVLGVLFGGGGLAPRTNQRLPWVGQQDFGVLFWKQRQGFRRTREAKQNVSRLSLKGTDIVL